MSRLKTLSPQQAKGRLKEIYQNIEKKMGKVINIFQTMGISEPVLEACLSMTDCAQRTSLSPRLREEIALVIAEANHCDYCLAAHTMLSQGLGLKSNEIQDSRRAESADPKTRTILRFARSLSDKRGKVTDQELTELRSKGVTDQEIADICLIVALNQFTNTFNNLAQTELDFPRAPKLESALSTSR